MTLSKDKKIYTIILEKHIKEKIDEIAKSQDRSSSNLINHILKQYIKKEYNNEEYKNNGAE